MRTPAKSVKKSKTSKKTYRTPKLTTHGNAAKITQHRHFPIITPGSGVTFG
jgi:hypothetical protein